MRFRSDKISFVTLPGELQRAAQWLCYSVST